MTWWTDLHLLRPWALLALVPLVALFAALWISRRHGSRWHQLIAPELIEHLLDGRSRKRSRKLLWGLLVGWIAASVALAGPTWEQRPTPVHRQADALVLVLDLSPSMVAEDVKPRRIVRARLKIADILDNRAEGETGLVVYGGDAHAVTPLTDDTQTISALLPTMSPGVMPTPGSLTEAGIDRAASMLEDAGYQRGRILLITDGVTDEAGKALKRRLRKTDFRLSILGIGSDQGAPIPSGGGGFVRENDGSVVITKLRSDKLADLAQSLDGRYRTAGFDQSDIQALLAGPASDSDNSRESDNTLDEWVDRGPWLALGLLPIVFYAFRRGVLLAILLVPLGLMSTPKAHAVAWDSLWLNPDQRGEKLLQKDAPAQAADTFKDPAWRANALYRAGDYQAAAQAFGELNTASADYNRGNALAQIGQLDDALAAYNNALEKKPELEDARANRKLVEQLKQQQNQNNQQQNNQNQKQKNSNDQQSSQQNGSSNQQQESQQPPQEEAEQSQQRQNNQQSSPQASASPQQDSQSSSETSPSQAQQTGQSSGGASSSRAAQSGQQKQNSSGGDETTQHSRQAAQSASAGASSSARAARAQQATREEREAQQAMEQWLRQIPDNPAGLMRNKFRYEYQKKRTERMRDQLNPSRDDEQRW